MNRCSTLICHLSSLLWHTKLLLFIKLSFICVNVKGKKSHCCRHPCFFLIFRRQTSCQKVATNTLTLFIHLHLGAWHPYLHWKLMLTAELTRTQTSKWPQMRFRQNQLFGRTIPVSPLHRWAPMPSYMIWLISMGEVDVFLKLLQPLFFVNFAKRSRWIKYNVGFQLRSLLSIFSHKVDTQNKQNLEALARNNQIFYSSLALMIQIPLLILPGIPCDRWALSI